MDSLETLVNSLVDGFVNLHQDNPRLHHVLSSEVPLSFDARARLRALKHSVTALVARGLDGHSPNPKLTAQLLVETADTLSHRWFAEEDGNLVSPGQMICELRRMFICYLIATSESPAGNAEKRSRF